MGVGGWRGWFEGWFGDVIQINSLSFNQQPPQSINPFIDIQFHLVESNPILFIFNLLSIQLH